jgi:hypothetical protein
VTFARLTRGDWLALAAALALLLVMSLDWYSTDAGEQAREDAAQTSPQGGPVSTETAKAIDDDAKIIADRAEKNAWQADPFADRVILLFLLATVALAIASAFLAAADFQFRQPWTPRALLTGLGLFTVLLVAARIVQKPSAEIGAVVKLGAPLGLACTGLVVIGARIAWNTEREGLGTAAERDDTGERAEPRAAARPPAPLFDHDEPGAEGGAATATATRPAVMEQPDELDADWAPDWSDTGAGAEADPGTEPEPATDRSRRRRRGRERGRRGKRPRRF